MKITAQEEYGLRILLQIALNADSEGMTIARISEKEGISQHYAAKLCRLLRLAGFINSVRGKEGGYTLAVPANQILLKDVIYALGGKLYSQDFCEDHSGLLQLCLHSLDCSVRSVWLLLQKAVDGVLEKLTLQDLLPKSPNDAAGSIEAAEDKTLSFQFNKS